MSLLGTAVSLLLIGRVLVDGIPRTGFGRGSPAVTERNAWSRRD